ncbi:MAG: site-2 protease family protein [Deltaproteobacteria bacterium]|nr:site-2 protease family protein [Deltaproteobacteria bacterium]
MKTELMDFDFQRFILLAVTYFVPMLLSSAVHEYAHARSAYALGDDTASREGRMTLNPFSHIDLFGSILLPLLFVFMIVQNPGAMVPFIAWAKPVPYNPLRFTRRVSMRGGAAIVAAAGPLSNLVLAVISTALLAVAFHIDPTLMRFNPTTMGFENPASELLFAFLRINVGLMLFNLIPLPPLDGSKVVAAFSKTYSDLMDRIAMFTFIFIILLVNTEVGRTIFGRPYVSIVSWLYSLAVPAPMALGT